MACPVTPPSSTTAPSSASISIGRPRSRSCSIEVLCAPTSAGAVDALVHAKWRIARPAPRPPPGPRPSSPGTAPAGRAGAVMRSSVAPVRAETGLKAELPHSFTQISSRMRGRTGAFSPAAISSRDSASTRGAAAAVRLAEAEAVAVGVLDHAGLAPPRRPDRPRSRSPAPAAAGPTACRRDRRCPRAGRAMARPAHRNTNRARR